VKFEVNRLDNLIVKADYQLEISNSFEILAVSSSNKDEIVKLIIPKMWEAISDTAEKQALV